MGTASLTLYADKRRQIHNDALGEFQEKNLPLGPLQTYLKSKISMRIL